MRTTWLLGVPVVMIGVAFLATALDFNVMLSAPLPADAQATGIQVGNARIPVATAILLQYLFFVLGLELVVSGFVMGLRGRPRAHPKRASPRPR